MTILLDSCDIITGWTPSGSGGPLSVNTTQFIEGIGALNLTKPGTGGSTIIYTKTITPVDLSAKTEVSLALFFVVSAFNELAFPGFAVRMRVGSDSSNYFEETFTKANLTYNTWSDPIGFAFFDIETTKIGNPDLASISHLELWIEFTTQFTFGDGDVLMDYWRAGVGTVIPPPDPEDPPPVGAIDLTYKVEILGTPFDETIEQVLSNKLIQVGGNEGVLTEIDQTNFNFALSLGSSTIKVLDNGSSTTGWVASGTATAPAVDNVTFKRGTGALKLGVNTGVTSAIYIKNPIDTPIDANGGDVLVWLYIKDLATLNKLHSVLGIRLEVEDQPNTAIWRLDYARGDLIVGWNNLGDLFPTNWTNFVGTSTLIESIQIEIFVNDSGTSIASGDLLLNYWRVANLNKFIIEDCNSLTGFTYSGEAIAPTLDLSESVELWSINMGKNAGSPSPPDVTVEACEAATGYVIDGGASQSTPLITFASSIGGGTNALGMGKNNGVNSFYGYKKEGLGPFDGTGKDGFVHFYIKDQATLDQLGIPTLDVEFLHDGGATSGKFTKNFSKLDMVVGWNKLGGGLDTVFNYIGDATKSTALANINGVRIFGRVINSTVVLTAGDLGMDYWHFEEGGNQNLFSYENASVGTTNVCPLSSSTGGVYLWIKDQATKDKLRTSDIPGRIQYHGSSGYVELDINLTDLTPGQWNLITGNLEGDYRLIGTNPCSGINKIHIDLWTEDPTDAITLGDLKMDLWFIDLDGDITEEYLGQQIKVPIDDSWLKSVETIIDRMPVPVIEDDRVRMRIMDLSHNILHTSPDLALVDDTDSFYTFNFNPHKLTGGTKYIFAMQRTGNPDPEDIYGLAVQLFGNPYDDGAIEAKSQGVWNTPITNASLVFKTDFITPNVEVAQGFRLGNLTSSLLTFSVWVGVVGSPTGHLVGKLYDENKVLLTIAPEQITGTGKQSFTFSYPLEANKDYFFSVSRSVASDPVNYFTILGQTGNPFADGSLWTRTVSGAWIEVPTEDLKFEITRQVTNLAFDLTPDVRQVTINVGKNDFGKKIQRGVCDIILNNDDLKYERLNVNSPVFGLYDFLQRFRVTAEFEGIAYAQFTGLLVSSTPALGWGENTVHAVLEDEFVVLDTEEVSIGVQTTKTAPELITALLDAAGFNINNRALDPDAVQLKTVTWDDVNVLEKLDVVIEAGQHSHFIDGWGVYNFKNNQWALDATPKFTFTDETIDGADIKDDLKTIKNRIHVSYNSSFADSEDANSIAAYGIYETTIVNELQPSNGIYAQSIANYIRDLKKDPGTNLEFKLENVFPEMLDLTFGDKIRFISTKAGKDEIYIIQAITIQINNSGKHIAKYKCRKRVGPPIVTNATIIEIAQTSIQYLDLNEANGTAISQSFRMVNAGTPFNVIFNLKHDLDVPNTIAVKIRAVDGSGFPTGPVLITSNPVDIVAGSTSGVYNFFFPQNGPVLALATDYVFEIDLPKTQEAVAGSDIGTIAIPGNQFLAATDTRQKVSQSFTAPRDLKVGSITLLVDYNTGGSSQNITLEIFNAVNDLPSGAALASRSITVNGARQENIIFDFGGSGPNLLNGQKYVWTMDVPATSFVNPVFRPFIGPDGWLPPCTDGNVIEVRQDFIWPWNNNILQLDMIIGACTDAISAKLWRLTGGAALIATSSPSTNGQFVFPTPPVGVAGYEYQLEIDVPVACRVQDGFSLAGENSGVGEGYITQFRFICSGGVPVLPQFNADMTFYGSTFGGNYWKLWGNPGGSYNQGRAGYFNGSSWVLDGNKDYQMTLSYTFGTTDYIYKNLWEVWGEPVGTYSNGKASEKVSGSWITKHPWDFYLQFTSVDE